MNKTTSKETHIGMAVILLLALANGSVNPLAHEGQMATPADIVQAVGPGQTVTERDTTTVEGGQKLVKAGCILCAAAILVGGGASVIGLIVLASAAPIATGACAFVCTLGYG